MVASTFEVTQVATGEKEGCGVEGAGDKLCIEIGARRKEREDLLDDFDWKDGSRVDFD